MNGTRAFAIVRKEVRQLLRDPLYLGLAFAVPLLLLLLFGYGMSLDVKHLPVVFLDLDRSPYSRDYIDRYVHSEYFDLVGVVSDRAESERWLRSGRARLVVEIPPDFARRIAGRRPTSLSVTVDGSFPARAAVMRGYTRAINAQYNRALLERNLAGRFPAVPVTMRSSVWYNPSLESLNSIVPGLIVLILMFFPAILGAMLVVRERETGTIFNLLSSPVSRWEILVGKAAPYVGVSFLNFLVAHGLSLWLFGVPFAGSFLVLATGVLLYASCTVGIGLLISIVARTQLAAMLVTFLATITPAFNYSGFMTPVASMDQTGQRIAQLIPATHFMSLVRGCYLKGLGFAAYQDALLTLAFYTALVYGAAWILLKKRIG